MITSNFYEARNDQPLNQDEKIVKAAYASNSVLSKSNDAIEVASSDTITENSLSNNKEYNLIPFEQNYSFE